MSRPVHTRESVIALLEHVLIDLRRGGTRFLALTVITPSAVDPSRPVTMVCKLHPEVTAARVNEAIAALADNAIAVGAMVPD